MGQGGSKEGDKEKEEERRLHKMHFLMSSWNPEGGEGRDIKIILRGKNLKRTVKIPFTRKEEQCGTFSFYVKACFLFFF